MIRRPSESVMIDGKIRVTLDFIKGNQASVKVEVPRGVLVEREELSEKKRS
ncbi:MAG: carbon storage regulator [Candidatus Thiodiazotropha sp.]|nr:carbon storage regulator [Candidatus Thiodiazotropha sp.]MCM8884546.1 carbon storage regulator [Candidatus Thiodiazotropha sp.]